MLSELNETKMPFLSENVKTNITLIIDTIKTNKNFSKLVIYYLNIIKTYVSVQNQNQAVENSLHILNSHFIEVLEYILPFNCENEEFLIKVGETIFYLATNLSTRPSDFQLLKKFNIISYVKKIIGNSPNKHVESNKIFLKVIHIIIEYSFNQNQDEKVELGEYFSLILNLIKKFQENLDLMIYLLETLKKISSFKKFKLLFTDDTNEGNSMKEFMETLLKLVSDTESNKIASYGLQILDSLLKIFDSREMMRNSKPISFIVKLIAKFKKDSMLSFHACNFLSKLIERDDVNAFLKVLKVRKNSALDLDQDNGVLTELKESLINQDEDTLKSIKKNIMRILILMSKDKAFLLLLKDINSLDLFVSLLKADFEVYSNGLNEEEMTEEVRIIESLLPEFMKLVLSLLPGYEFEVENEANNNAVLNKVRNSMLSNNEKRMSLVKYDSIDANENLSAEILSNSLKDISYCLFKSLYYFSNDKEITYEILNFISNRNIKITQDYFEYIQTCHQNDFENVFTEILKKYYEKRWIYDFFNKFSQFLKITNDFNQMCSNLSQEVESYQLISQSYKKNNIISMIFNIIFKLINQNPDNEFLYGDNSFGEYHQVVIKLIDIQDIDIMKSTLTLSFSGAENKFLGQGNWEDKGRLILKLINKIIHTHMIESAEFKSLIKYVLMRLNRLITLKIENINSLIFNSEVMCDFLINSIILTQPECGKKIDEEFTKEILEIVNFLISSTDCMQVSRFLRADGLIYIMKLCKSGLYDFDISKLIIHIMQLLIKNHFKESVLLFKNFIVLRNFLTELKELKFSKGINERIYFEFLTFLKNIVKSCEFSEAVEETCLIEHLVNEYSEIYTFYLDFNNRLLEIISEILSMLSKEKNLLKNIINTKFLDLIANILKHINSNETIDNSFSEVIFEYFTNIFLSFFRSKQYSKIIYSNYKGTIEICKNILFNQKLSEQVFKKMLTLCQLIIQYENEEVVKDRCMMPIYFKELAMKIPPTQNNLKEMIDKCVMHIENPFADRIRRSINESNTKLIKELNELVKSDRKNVIHYKQGHSESISDLNSNAKEEVYTRNKRRSLINIEDNPVIKRHFSNIINNFSVIIDLIIDKGDYTNLEQECEQLTDLLKMLAIFAKDEENIKLIYENDVIDKLIYVLDNKTILTFTQDQAYNLIGKIIECEDQIEKFFENGRACEFFLKEANKVGKIYFPDASEYLRNKVLIVTKIISKLTKAKLFNMNNSEYININTIYNTLITLQCDKDIISNYLEIFNNLIINTSGVINFSSMKISEMIIHSFWKKYSSDIRIIEKIMLIIQNLYLEETIIKDLLDFDLVERLNEILTNTKIDSSGIYNLLVLIDILIFHRYFAAKVIEQRTLNNLFHIINLNMFNTKIIHTSLSIFIKASKMDKNFITILGVYGVNEFCLQVMSKYVKTCHTKIVKSTIELILILTSDENNMNFFNLSKSMDVILNTFKAHLKNKQHVHLNLKLINLITSKTVMLSSKLNQSDVNLPYDFNVLLEIINEVLAIYDDQYEIIMQLCDLIVNIFKISSEIWLKMYMMNIIVNNVDKYITKQEYLQVFLQTILLMVKGDKTMLDLDCSSVLHYIGKIISAKLNYNIIINILKILKQVGRSKNVNSSSNVSELIKILKALEENRNFHDDEIVLLFSQVLGYLCANTSFYREVSSEFIIFLFEYAIAKPNQSLVHVKLLEDMKSISVFFNISSESKANSISELCVKCFSLNLQNKNKKNLMNIFQIISSLCIQSDYMKTAFNLFSFSNDLKKVISENVLDDTLLDYQAKGCLLNLKLKKVSSTYSKITTTSTLRSMSLLLSKVEIKEEVRFFLQTERGVKLYSDKGEIKKRFIKMNDNLDEIYSIVKGKDDTDEVMEKMDIKEMDSIVRSCGTCAFSKAKGLFTKKPKPARCFSILGVKSLTLSQKTFNIECENEEDCIKYVDYISILIQNYKSMKDDQITLSSNDLLLEK